MARGGPQGPGLQEPRGAHKGPTHKGIGGGHKGLAHQVSGGATYIYMYIYTHMYIYIYTNDSALSIQVAKHSIMSQTATQVDLSWAIHIRQQTCLLFVTQQTCLLCHTADMSAM